jgi:hypothetical protein
MQEPATWYLLRGDKQYGPVSDRELFRMIEGGHHANAHHMAVELEPFVEARDRIKAVGYDVLCVRRLPELSKSR